MATVEEHYARLLAEHYTWMSGGFEARLAENARFFQSLRLPVQPHDKALDLGCGSGFQTLALTALGYDVLAIDSSPELLRELRSRGAGQSFIAVTGDLRESRLYEAHGPFAVAVCMGDTLVHLATRDEVTACLASVRRCLRPAATLVLSFRDLSTELTGVNRILPVRLDDERLMSVFLEYESERVVVHDQIFTRGANGWTLQTSAYRKLRLSADDVAHDLRGCGYQSLQISVNRGFTTIVART